MENYRKKQNVTSKVCIDFLLLIIFSSFIALFYDYMEPYQRGFYCDDENIMYPPKVERISDELRWYISVFPPVVVIVLVEVYRNYIGSNRSIDDEAWLYGWKVPDMFQHIYRYSGIFLFGLFMTEIINSTIKFSYGRLRPAFLEICKPDFNCTEVLDPHFYVEKFNCTNIDIDETNIRLSFPSGHAAFAAYAYMYIVFYLQKRMTVPLSILLKPLIQLLFLLLTVYVSLTRIQDNKHHWDDVLCGNILGFLVCIVMISTQTDLFKSDTPIPKEAHSQTLEFTETSISKSNVQL